MSKTLDLLLRNEIPTPRTKEFRHKRLSKAFGEDVIFTLKELSFSRVAEIKQMDDEEMEIHILLAGLVDPDPKNNDLLAKYSAVTPAELLKKMLLPGEITDLSREIEKLAGFRTATLEEMEKK